MEENRREENIVVNDVYRLYGSLRYAGISNANDRLDCTLFILYSLYKQIPFPGTLQDSDIEALKGSVDVLYNRLYHSIELYLRDPRYNHVLRDAYLHMLHSNRDVFKSLYPQALSFLFQFTYEYSGKRAAEFYQPAGLSYLIAHILNSYDIKSVYNPFAGTARIMKNLRNDIHYLAQEINGKQVLYAQILKDAFLADNAHIIQGDSIRDWQGQHYDAIYATMPWGLRVYEFGESQGTSEAFFLRKASEDAVLSIGVYPYGVLFRGGKEKALRTNIVKSDLVDCVIKLPAHLFAPMTNVQTCIIITNKRKTRKGCVRLIDASSYVMPDRAFSRLDVDRLLQVVLNPDMENQDVIWVENDAILKNNSNLLIERYQPIDLPEVQDGYKLVKLNTLLERITLHKQTEEATIPLIRVSDLAFNPLDFVLASFKAENRPYISGLVYVNEPALFVSRYRPLKPTWYAEDGRETGKGVYVKDLFAFRIIGEVTPPYLLNELTKEYVQKQLIYSGAALQSISASDFLEIQILLPSLEEQNLSVMQGIKEEKELGKEEVSQSKEKYLRDLGARQHTLNHIMQDIWNAYKPILRTREDNNGILHDEDIVSIYDDTVSDSFDSLTYSLKRIGDLISELDKAIEPGQKEPVNVIDFFMRFKRNHPHPNFEFSIDYPAKTGKGKEAFWIEFCVKDLEVVVDNIIANAQKHGFRDRNEGNSIRVIISNCDMRTGEPAVKILIMNNGTPLPDDFPIENVFKWGKYNQVSGGKGIGGYQIKEFVEYFGGKVRFLTSEYLPEGYTAAYEIVLPFKSHQ